MIRTSYLLAVLTGLIILVFGCSTGQNPVDSQDKGYSMTKIRTSTIAATIEIPEGAEIRSATLNMYVVTPGLQTVDIHRVAGSWDEGTVTWNSFAGAYAPEIEGSFTANSPGWKTADITPLVKSWLEGKNENFGLLLDQVVIDYPRSIYFSRESSINPPYLKLCYTSSGGEVCDTVAPSADVYINQSKPDDTSGSATALFTGWAADGGNENQTLIGFDLPTPPPPPPPDTNHGCTMPSTYWIRHSGCAQWIQSDEITPLLPIWLGTPGGEKSIEIVENCHALRFLHVKMTSQKANPCGKLVSQLLAAKLNIANGADNADIVQTIDEADDFLAVNDWGNRKYLTRRSWKQILMWTYKLHRFNKGKIGPGSCMTENKYGKRCRK